MNYDILLLLPTIAIPFMLLVDLARDHKQTDLCRPLDEQQ